MLVVETVAKIRRAYFVQGKAIKAICRDLLVSRKVVRKVLRSEATAFHYERDEQPLPRIGPWRDALDSLLQANEGKSARERLTLIRIFEELRSRGYEGGYDAVRRYARSWQRDRAATSVDAHVPLSFAPGEAYQFDWSHEIVLINGTTVTVKVAHLRLCHSRMLFVRAYPRETQEMVFDAHDRGFAFFKGACTHELMEARDERRLRALQKHLNTVKLLIVDELGYVPFTAVGSELLFEVFSQRYERGATLVTSNLPFDEWTSIFSSERLTGALLDRLTHHVHILDMAGTQNWCSTRAC